MSNLVHMKREMVGGQSRLPEPRSDGRQPAANSGVELEALKVRLVVEQQRAGSDPDVQSWFARAADEAASIACATTYPLLVFPMLLQEKIEDAERKGRIKRQVYGRRTATVTLAA